MEIETDTEDEEVEELQERQSSRGSSHVEHECHVHNLGVNVGASTSTKYGTRTGGNVKAKLPKHKIIKALKPLITSMIHSSGLGTMRAESDLERTIVLQASAIVDLKSKQEQLLIRMLESSSQLKDVKEQMLEIQRRISPNQRN